MLSAPNVFLRPNNQRKEADDARAQFTHPLGDHLTLLNVFHAFKSSESACPYHADSVPVSILTHVPCLLCSSDPDPQWAWNNYLSHRALLQADNIRNQLTRVMERHDL